MGRGGHIGLIGGFIIIVGIGIGVRVGCSVGIGVRVGCSVGIGVRLGKYCGVGVDGQRAGVQGIKELDLSMAIWGMEFITLPLEELNAGTLS